ncbi:hypothetical protein EV385_6084 [Krasilnikovia cinnamomea]|uniref:Uncharacterized protein n=1 Tax=Krasilnikovia cinnamomea TaxID=349313 RepID=A0A4Q7ZU94_9ACTN|nr:hypothetical protein [Krasilnikovia cinnamomea]RZU54145.1 hypothetical protein EV385_6084 [Krasilnikovia cinnamomea]
MNAVNPYGPPPPEFRDELPAPPIDPVRQLDPATVRPWQGLLAAGVGAEWAVSSVRRLTAPMRVTTSGALLDEEPFTLRRAVVPDRALDPAQNPGLPVADRLRRRFRVMLPHGSAPVSEGEPCRIGELPARCDRFRDRTGEGLRAFVVSADTGELDAGGSPVGVVAVVSGPPSRYETVAATGWSLATAAVPGRPWREWAAPDGWHWSETLQLDAGDRIVNASIEETWAQDLDEWTGEVFARAPFLRGKRTLGDRPVRVDGLREARMHRFDWQPSGRGRMLTNVVVGVQDGVGFQLVMELPFHADAALSATLDDVLPAVRLGL